MHSLAAKHIAPSQTVNDVTLSRSTDPVDVTKGVHQFYQSGAAIPGLLPKTTWLQRTSFPPYVYRRNALVVPLTRAAADIDLQHYLTRPNEDPLDNAPDIFCYVYDVVA
jgi:hypothetical protein